jgi:hypothetical protein
VGDGDDDQGDEEPGPVASTMSQTALVGAGPTPSPEGGQSQAGPDPCGQDPDANNETGRGRPAVRPAGRTSWRPTKGRFTTSGQHP